MQRAGTRSAVRSLAAQPEDKFWSKGPSVGFGTSVTDLLQQEHTPSLSEKVPPPGIYAFKNRSLMGAMLIQITTVSPVELGELMVVPVSGIEVYLYCPFKMLPSLRHHHIT